MWSADKHVLSNMQLGLGNHLRRGDVIDSGKPALTGERRKNQGGEKKNDWNGGEKEKSYESSYSKLAKTEGIEPARGRKRKKHDREEEKNLTLKSDRERILN